MPQRSEVALRGHSRSRPGECRDRGVPSATAAPARPSSSPRSTAAAGTRRPVRPTTSSNSTTSPPRRWTSRIGLSSTTPSSTGNTGDLHHRLGIDAPGGFLVQLAGSTNGVTPTPDSSCSSPNLSGTTGSVELANPAGLVDLVGYGAATDANAGKVPVRDRPAPGRPTPRQRPARDPKVDTDNNSANFSSGAPPEEHRIRRRRSIPLSRSARPSPRSRARARTPAGWSGGDHDRSGDRGIPDGRSPTAPTSRPPAAAAERRHARASDGIFVFVGCGRRTGRGCLCHGDRDGQGVQRPDRTRQAHHHAEGRLRSGPADGAHHTAGE